MVFISRNSELPGGSFSELPSSNLESEHCLDRKNPKAAGFSKLLFILNKNHNFFGNFCVRTWKKFELIFNFFDVQKLLFQ